jgi:hypothetical protein
MTYKVHPFRRFESEDATGGATDLVESDVVPPGVTRVVQHIAVFDETNAVTQVRILIKSTGPDYLIDEKETLGADDPYIYTHPLFLHEGEWLACEFTGATANDKLRLNYSGYDRIPDRVHGRLREDA